MPTILNFSIEHRAVGIESRQVRTAEVSQLPQEEFIGVYPLNRALFLTRPSNLRHNHAAGSEIELARWEIKLSPLNCTRSLKDAEKPISAQRRVLCYPLPENMHPHNAAGGDESEVRRSGRSATLASTCAGISHEGMRSAKVWR